MASETCYFNYATPHNIVNAYNSHWVFHNHRLIDDNKNKD